MKIPKSLLTYFAFGLGTILLTGCKKDETSPGGDPPTLAVSAAILNGGPLNDNGTVVATDTIDFSIDVTAPAGFNSVLIGGAGNSILDQGDAGVAALTTQVDDIPFRVFTKDSDGGGLAKYSFVAVDEIGQQSDTVQFSFNITSTVDFYTSVILGGFEHTSVGSFYDAIENSISTVLSAPSNSAKIDLLFYHTNSNGYTISSIDDSDADAALEAQTTSDLDTFSARNATRFRTFSSAPNFDAIRTIPDLQNAYSSNVQVSGLSSITNLVSANIIGFQIATARGARVGLIQILDTAGTTGSNRSLRINVKIEPE
ncbi:MAG: hypothetical protein ABJP45_18540 [Cyclobacteriaceae bacterium]